MKSFSLTLHELNKLLTVPGVLRAD